MLQCGNETGGIHERSVDQRPCFASDGMQKMEENSFMRSCVYASGRGLEGL